MAARPVFGSNYQPFQPTRLLFAALFAPSCFLARRKVKHRKHRDANSLLFLLPYATLPFDDAAANAYGYLRAQLAAKGLSIGPLDLAIAAIAVSRGLILVTHNTREFSRISDLTLEDWENL